MSIIQSSSGYLKKKVENIEYTLLMDIFHYKNNKNQTNLWELMYTDTDLEDLRRAGKIVSEIFKKIQPLIVPRVKYSYLADSIEKTIRSKNDARPAFPPNI